jgi:hypothetical protein
MVDDQQDDIVLVDPLKLGAFSWIKKSLMTRRGWLEGELTQSIWHCVEVVSVNEVDDNESSKISSYLYSTHRTIPPNKLLLNIAAYDEEIQNKQKKLAAMELRTTTSPKFFESSATRMVWWNLGFWVLTILCGQCPRNSQEVANVLWQGNWRTCSDVRT